MPRKLSTGCTRHCLIFFSVFEIPAHAPMAAWGSLSFQVKGILSAIVLLGQKVVTSLVAFSLLHSLEVF